MSMARQIYGIHAPVKMLMERRIVAKAESGRLPVLSSSNLGLEILMGRDETIDFEDFLTGKALIARTSSGEEEMNEKNVDFTYYYDFIFFY